MLYSWACERVGIVIRTQKNSFNRKIALIFFFNKSFGSQLYEILFLLKIVEDLNP